MRLSIAPMMDYSDRHFRRMFRMMSASVFTYTEMIPALAVIHGGADRFLAIDDTEGPVVLQLGGSDPGELARATELAASWKYTEINLNAGCPSDRVSSGAFGAAMMADPERTHDCLAAMKSATRLPVTIKCRIGISGLESYDDLLHYANRCQQAGADRMIIHARLAVLGGLSPRENREIPPLRYEVVHRLQRDMPGMPVELNGGLRSFQMALEEANGLAGCMLGRLAIDDPWHFSKADSTISGIPDRYSDPADLLMDYLQASADSNASIRTILKPTHNLFAGRTGARRYRRWVNDISLSGISATGLAEKAQSQIEQFRNFRDTETPVQHV